MSGTQGLPEAFTAALLRARMTGQPVAIPNPDGTPSTLMALPGGGFGTPGGGMGSQLPVPPIPPQVGQQRVAPSAPLTTAGVQGLPGSPSGPAVMPPAPLRVQPPLNQANPNTTYVSPNTPQPAGSAPVVGQPGTQSGQPPVNPELVVSARRYRQAHGLATSDDTDALNAESLAAAQAGRTYFNPTLAAQYGQPLPAGVSGPRTDVINALAMPPAVAQQPTQLAMPPPAQQVAQNLLQQGIY